MIAAQFCSASLRNLMTRFRAQNIAYSWLSVGPCTWPAVQLVCHQLCVSRCLGPVARGDWARGRRARRMTSSNIDSQLLLLLLRVRECCVARSFAKRPTCARHEANMNLK